MHSQRKRSELSLARGARPWTETAKLTGLTNCRRVSDVIDCGWALRRKQLGADVPPEVVKQDLWANPSQAVQRNPISTKMPLLCQGTIPYSYNEDTCLSGRDVLCCQGYPKGPQFTPEHILNDKDCRSIAGEAFFLPDFACVTEAYWLNPKGPWWNS